jgi:hypothetical protein
VINIPHALHSAEEQHLLNHHPDEVPYAIDNRTRIAVIMTYNIQMAIGANRQ